MKVTTQKWTNNAGCPALYDVLVNGDKVGTGTHSELRVLKMGKCWLPVDDNGGLGNFGAFSTRKEAAEYVARKRFGNA